MIEQSARVVETENRFAWVEAERRSACSSCSAKGCGTGVLADVLGGKRQRLRIENRIGAETGDTIVIGLREEALVRGSLAAYIVPLLAMIGGALLGEAVASQWQAGATEIWAILAGLCGFGGGLWWLHRFGRQIAGGDRYQAVALRIVGRCHPVGGSAAEVEQVTK